MEKRFISGKDQYKKSRENLELPVEKQRFLFYSGYIQPFSTKSVIETEDNIYWVEDTYRPRFSKCLFYTNKGNSGISVDKKKKTVKLWFGKPPSLDLIQSFLAYYNVDWMNTIQRPFSDYFGAAFASAVVKGKMKSSKDFAIFLSKRTIMLKDVDPILLLKLMHYNTGGELSLGMETIGMGFKVASDPSEYVDMLLVNGCSWRYLTDFRDATAVGVKLDFSSIDNYLLKSREVLRIEIQKHRGLNDLPDMPF